jgi:DNA-binding NarL/FixJ family response regulator
MKNASGLIADNGSVDAINAVAKELDAIKGLLVLLLMKGGAKQTEIAKALGTSQATVSKQFRLGDVDPITVVVLTDEDKD